MEETTQITERQYEITFVAENEDGALIKGILEKHGAHIVKEVPIQKIRAAYPLKKHAYGFLGIYEFTIAQEKLPELQGALKLERTILRTLISIKESAKEGKGKRVFTGKPGVSRSPRPKKTFDAPPVLTNEALQEKIEEILQ